MKWKEQLSCSVDKLLDIISYYSRVGVWFSITIHFSEVKLKSIIKIEIIKCSFEYILLQLQWDHLLRDLLCIPISIHKTKRGRQYLTLAKQLHQIQKNVNKPRSRTVWIITIYHYQKEFLFKKKKTSVSCTLFRDVMTEYEQFN